MQNALTIPLLDLIVIVVYLGGILVVGIFAVRRQKITSSSYFLANKSLSWVIIGAALFAANISTIQVVGLAASGFNEGLVWGNFEWMATFTLMLLGLVFAPFYFRSRIETLPEFLEKRFSSASRTMLAFIGIISALFVHIGLSLYAGAVVIHGFFGLDVLSSILIISVITAIYTVFGGLKSVVITETIQTVIMIGGSIALTVIALFKLPDVGIRSWADLQAAVKPGQLSMIHGSQDGNGLSWYAVLLGYPVLGIWYWCTDQTIVQRVLGARSERDAQLGPLFAGFLKILPLFILVLPGVLAYVLFRDIITDSNQALPVLINQIMPTGMRGLLAASLLAALMSTVAAGLNSSATLVAIDVVKRLRPATTDDQQVRIGRMSAVVVMIVAMLWSTQGGRFQSIFEAINKIASCLAPPISAVFLLGVFSKRGTKEAAFITLFVGFLLGMVVFMVDMPLIGETRIITDGWGIPFMMQAWWLFCISCGLFFAVSVVTPRPDPEQIRTMTWPSPLAVVTRGRITGWTDPRIIAGVLFAVMMFLYYCFR